MGKEKDGVPTRLLVPKSGNAVLEKFFSSIEFQKDLEERRVD